MRAFLKSFGPSKVHPGYNVIHVNILVEDEVLKCKFMQSRTYTVCNKHILFKPFLHKNVILSMTTSETGEVFVSNIRLSKESEVA